MKKFSVPASAVLLAAAFVAAAVLDAPQVVSQVLLPLLVVFSVTGRRRFNCFQRGGQP
ncbi:hypothetical protein [Rhodanobacter sp. PCA2]|uniref:hypothetical protein n=1 Tax=Rhodanobacter sp. PCA2 TaxID=2006117 RepID=UPI0015E6CD30|nr:hypothetical protein [Rhodanobacter sp. PCA2]